MAQKVYAGKELDDMTECSICTEVFTDPRVLPCIHTFCLKCLLNYCKDRLPGDDMPCPLCRKEFTIPDDGLSGIQKNFLMEKLLRAKKLSSGGEGGRILCEIHKGEEIKVYCLECKVAICVMCVIKSHKTHDCSDIEEVSVDLRQQMISDTDKANERLKKTGEVLPRFDKERSQLVYHLAGIEDEINRAANKLIVAVNRDRMKLLTKVESVKRKRIKQLQTAKQEVEQHMTALESFRRYSEALLSSGTACDVARSANSLHDRADELMMYEVVSHVDSSLAQFNKPVRFLASTALDRDSGNLIGSVVLTDTTPSQPAVTHVIPKGKSVGGVTSLGNDVFVARHDSQQIEVYDALSFTLQRCLAVPELGSQPLGLAVCPINNCLYASDFDNSSIHRVELSGSNAVMKWSVATKPAGLAVNRAQNLLVASAGEGKLQEFTTVGTLLQNVQLGGEPWHAVDMASNHFVVSSGEPLHGVCLVEKNGVVVRSCGEHQMKMNCPSGLAVDKHGNILVADWLNHRLLVLDSLLMRAHEMSVSITGGLRFPYSLWYDKSRGRLYIGEWEWSGGRVVVIDHLQEFNTSQL